jgi:hypothetical protein
MLFDLRARGRRRAIKVIYLGLAVLMGGGLVFFGIGGATNGGLLDAFKGGNGGTTSNKVLEKRIERAQQTVHLRPTDPVAWAALTRYQFQLAGTDFNDQTGQYGSDGIQHLRQAGRSWDRYTALNPKKPDPQLASLMTQAFLPDALNKPEEAVSAWEIVVDSRPASTGLYTQLATLAYGAGQTRKGDLAAQKAVELAPKDQRSALKDQLKSLKEQPAGGASGTASASG